MTEQNLTIKTIALRHKHNLGHVALSAFADAVRDAYLAGEQAGIQAGMTEAAEIANVSLYESGRQSEGYYAERKILTARDAKKV